MRSERIAVVGIGLRYPDAGSTDELWENVLAGRRAFRRLPDERMNHADYWSPNPSAPDRFYSSKAAVLRDFEFDRAKYKIAGSTFRATDMTHWLALDVAAAALEDAGFAAGDGLPKRSTGVVLGNSLTGEFSRANLMRLRWPYVRRTVAEALRGRGWAEQETADFLQDLEVRYKEPFAPIGEDSLAGGLANTIAGRICNHFDLGGGGYTVDGACSSSLLSVATAADALGRGDLDVALAGGVDLSIDPFEVIGFAKTGALATGEMKVYDRGSNGFWPGEGAATVVLMREADAVATGKRIYATLAGWGVSSDGKGGITRPEASGHRLALTRAYEHAGYGLEAVSYFEGHGTGTAVGDATEIEALSSARRDTDPTAVPAALSTIKANIGHTKAAAGVAGLIKAVLAVHHQVIPPATGHHDPHPRLLDDARVYVPSTAELWPADRPVRAGVSAMGFGGINTHIAIDQAPDVARRQELDARTVEVVGGRQDAELLLLDGGDLDEIRVRARQLAELLPKLSYAELGDLAHELAGELTGGPVRAALVVRGPEDAASKVSALLEHADAGLGGAVSRREGVFLAADADPKIAFLFPGQGSGRGAFGAIRRRFPAAEALFRAAALPAGGDQVATEVAQPRIVTGSLAALAVLQELGVEADVAVGHSLGELTALHWAGAMTAAQVQELARRRGRVMATASEGGGAMAGLATGPAEAERFAAGHDVVIAGYNGPHQTVLSGPARAIDQVCAAAGAAGVSATRINVSHAFHSPLVRPAAVAMERELADFEFQPLSRSLASTVTGAVLDLGTDLGALLRDQVLAPVRFHEAAATAVADADLVLEVGPGRVLSGLVETIAPGKPVLPVDVDSLSLTPLLAALGAAFALGAPVDVAALFTGRVVRPLPLDGAMTFLANPCESAPEIDAELLAAPEPGSAADTGTSGADSAASSLELLRKLVAERIELPLEMIGPDTHPLDDLHLSSITVGQIVNEAVRGLGSSSLETTPNFATVRLGELAEMIDGLVSTAQDGVDDTGEVPGVAQWVRPFEVEHVVAAAPPPAELGASTGSWSVHASPGHPLADALADALARAGVGDGVLLCLPPDPEEHVALLLEAGRAAAAAPAGTRFVVVQHRRGAAGLARTAHLENRAVRTTLVVLDDQAQLAGEVDELVARVTAEVAATSGFSEVHYDVDGTRRVPQLRALQTDPEPGMPPALGPEDVLLVTGGGKGITAECALVLAGDFRAKLALLGRADPAEDAELAANLARMDAAGVQYRYERADVTSREQVRAAVERIQSELGAVTAVLHGAGRNQPTALANLTEEEFQRTLAPKVAGLRAVLAAVDPDRIRLLITFGSIIGRAGLRGEAHYATANEWMSELTANFQREHPNARALALEWSVWSGAGMGERLGVVESLVRDGISPISTENGLAVLKEVLADPGAGPVLVVSGRAAGLPTITMPRPELPLHRFVDRVLVHYPDVELITEAHLSEGADPYLSDHLLDGDLLFPAVLGMEAMAQVTAALTGWTAPPVLEDVEFLRPVVVRPGGSTTIRLAALRRGPDAVEVVLRSAETGFSADHFRARLRSTRADLRAREEGPIADLPVVPVDPVAELYGGILFQGKRFQRLLNYRRASARRAVAELSTSSPAPWFAGFLSQQRVLADPGTRDAVMHAIQCCVPDATLLPQGVERLHLADPAVLNTDYVVLDARERAQDGDSYVYDVDVLSPDGVPVERWEGLKLRAVRKRGAEGPWVPAMLGSVLERNLERVLGGSRAVVVEPDPAPTSDVGTEQRRAQSATALARALGGPVQLRHRPDGKPEVDGADVSLSHGAGLTLAVAGRGPLGCDVETVVERDEAAWRDLLGGELLAVRDLIAAESGEFRAMAGTRVWSALECLRKAGSTSRTLTVGLVATDGWVLLSAGDFEVATWATTIDDRPAPVVFAVLGKKEG